MKGTAGIGDRPLPDGWRWARLGEIADIIPGQSPPGSSYNESGIGTPFHQGKTEFTRKFIGNCSKWTTDPRRFAEADDILMSVRAPVGPVNLATERIAIGRGLAVIKPHKHRLTAMYTYYALRHLEPAIVGNPGSVFSSINKSDIQDIYIPLPPLAEQHRIVRILDDRLATIEKAKRAAEEQIESIEALQTAYLRTALAGEL